MDTNFFLKVDAGVEFKRAPEIYRNFLPFFFNDPRGNQHFFLQISTNYSTPPGIDISEVKPMCLDDNTER